LAPSTDEQAAHANIENFTNPSQRINFERRAPPNVCERHSELLASGVMSDARGLRYLFIEAYVG
jgi:hypothetical protein